MVRTLQNDHWLRKQGRNESSLEMDSPYLHPVAMVTLV